MLRSFTSRGTFIIIFELVLVKRTSQNARYFASVFVRFFFFKSVAFLCVPSSWYSERKCQHLQVHRKILFRRMRSRNGIYMAVREIVSVVSACTFGRLQTKSSATPTRAANFNGQRNTLCLPNLWQNCMRESSAYFAAVRWAQWRRWAPPPHTPPLGSGWGYVSGGPPNIWNINFSFWLLRTGFWGVGIAQSV